MISDGVPVEKLRTGVETWEKGPRKDFVMKLIDRIEFGEEELTTAYLLGYEHGKDQKLPSTSCKVILYHPGDAELLKDARRILSSLIGENEIEYAAIKMLDRYINETSDGD